MKIRKNPNGLPVDGTSIPKHSSFIVCELNRSPWDDEVLFAEFVEKWDAGMNLNGSSADPIVISDSNSDEDKDEDEDEVEEDLMDVSFDNVENENLKIPSMLVNDKEEKPIKVVPEAEVIPSDIQPSPQVKQSSRVSKELAPPPSPPSSHVPARKKRGRSMKPLSSTKVVISGVSSGRSSRGRILKNTYKNYNNNSDGFYYYSGFGPSWGKNRGGDMSNCSNTSAASSSVATTENNGGSIGHKKNNVPKDSDDVMNEDREAYAEVSNKKKSSSNAPSITIEKKKKNKASASDVEYVYEDDDDAPVEVLQDGKRIRRQKLVKYRSINEIMRLTKMIDL